MIEPLVLLPGLMADARLFWPQLAALSREMAVTVAPVTLGERIEEMASALLPQLPARFALAGLGLGGMVAMELVRRAPERVNRLCLISTMPLPDSPQFAAEREGRIVAARSGRLMDVMREEIPSTALAPLPDRAEILGLVAQMAADMGPEVYVRQTRALQRRKDQQPTLRKVRQPVLILCGAHDAVMPVKRHEFMAELIPFAQLAVLPEAGHLPTLEQPGQVTRALRDWLRMPLVLR